MSSSDSTPATISNSTTTVELDDRVVHAKHGDYEDDGDRFYIDICVYGFMTVCEGDRFHKVRINKEGRAIEATDALVKRVIQAEDSICIELLTPSLTIKLLN